MIKTASLKHELSQLDWWCYHYKDGLYHLAHRMQQYFDALNSDDSEVAERLQLIIETNIKEYIRISE